jgi:hypothetical protein
MTQTEEKSIGRFLKLIIHNSQFIIRPRVGTDAEGGKQRFIRSSVGWFFILFSVNIRFQVRHSVIVIALTATFSSALRRGIQKTLKA